MKRRDFLGRLGWGLAGGWAVSRWSWPGIAAAAFIPPRLALLGDAHLRDGNASRPEARALARAVAEIRSLKPVPDLALFAGDLAHDGNPHALELGREILADLPAPLLLVMGEGDGPGTGTAAWKRLFGETRFSRSLTASPDKQCFLRSLAKTENLNTGLLQKTENRKPKTVIQILGIHTSLSPSPQGSVFEVGREQRGWLARELARLDPATPLIILSHAPLGEIFRPWQQWTQDGPEVMRLLARFSQVFCFHGHVHNGTVCGPRSAVSFGLMRRDNLLPGDNRKPKTENFPLPATAWPLPSPLQGTLTATRPGLGPRGCGWGLATAGEKYFTYQPQEWRA